MKKLMILGLMLTVLPLSCFDLKIKLSNNFLNYDGSYRFHLKEKNCSSDILMGTALVLKKFI